MKNLLVLFPVLALLLCAGLFQTSNLLAADKTATDNYQLALAAEQGHAQSGQHAEGAQAEGEHQGAGHIDLGTVLPLWSVIPFVGILLSISVIPLINGHWWHHNFPKISAFWGVIFVVPFLIAYKGAAWHEVLHIAVADYMPFIILLWGLFTASGGILVRGRLPGTPIGNAIVLLIGTFLASWIGTTGAAMLLIRPLLRSNNKRQYKVHTVIFFIFLVANIGGSLTPLGDPPLFLGFLRGVHFFWTMHLLPLMGVMVGILLPLYFIFDTILYSREKKSNPALVADPNEPAMSVSFAGLHNILFLLGIMGAVLMSGMLKLPEVNIGGVHLAAQNLLRDGLIVLMGILSLKTTKKELRVENEFDWFPIKEVAILFAGIFATIIPALAILRAGTEGHLAFVIEFVRNPWQYFWITGLLSSFLDNAPTYLTFFNTAVGQLYHGVDLHTAVNGLMYDKTIFLEAISAGAVFMGANTYIGNAPNFMVKSIAEQSGVKMPSFFGYMVWSICILCPLYFVLKLIFFSAI